MRLVKERGLREDYEDYEYNKEVVCYGMGIWRRCLGLCALFRG